MSQPRQAAGVPAGGQFAAESRPHADVSLDQGAVYDPWASKTLRCTFCGGELRVETETEGSAYLSYDRPSAIECDNWQCAARWKPDGTLVQEPGYRLYDRDEPEGLICTVQLSPATLSDLARQVDDHLRGQGAADQATTEEVLAALLAVQLAAEAATDEHGPLRRQEFMSDRDWACIVNARTAASEGV